MAARLSAERQQLIVEIVCEQRTVTVEELSARLGVSEATIRRDLDKLNQSGMLQRAHGGAIAVQQTEPEPPVVRREVGNQDLKRRIGRATADLIEEGDTIFLGSGTTTIEVARHLGGKRRLRVITNALNVANVLATMPDITTILIGGMLRHSEMSLIGHLAEQSVADLTANKVIMGVRALSAERGLTNDFGLETSLDRTIVKCASQLIVVADHSKIGKTASVVIAPASAVHTLVTDTFATQERVEELRQLGIRVILA
jgi:DeoR/GlpR family transcriptional regulator of sugar metabolism